MAGIIENIIQNSIAGFVGGAVSTAGGYAGSAVSGLGTIIENAGESVGNGMLSLHAPTHLLSPLVPLSRTS